MTDPVSRKNLLPPAVFPREQAIHDADAAVEDLDPAAVIRARDPDTALLGGELEALAWERSVDVWDPTWPEAIKRAVVKAAPEVHRHKGTVFAVKRALSALNIAAEVTEWWQMSPKGAPYTFTVNAYTSGYLYDGPLLDARLLRVAFSSVMRAKPTSRAFELFLGPHFPMQLGLAPVLVGRQRIAASLAPKLGGEFATTLGLAPVLVARVRVALALTPALPL